MTRRLAGRILLTAVLAAGAIWALVNRDGLDVAAIEAWVRGAGIWGPALFIGLYALATVLLLPRIVKRPRKAPADGFAE